MFMLLLLLLSLLSFSYKEWLFNVMFAALAAVDVGLCYVADVAIFSNERLLIEAYKVLVSFFFLV